MEGTTMARLLVVYATVEGHTRKVAEHIAERVRQLGHTPVLVDGSTALPGLQEEGEYDAAVICAPVHQGEYPEAIVDLVRENRDDLSRMPTAFLSVSLAAAMAEAEYQEEALSYIRGFIERTGWTPTEEISVAGALVYTKYDYFKRLVMKLIADRRGGDTDTSKDYEYTDWTALDRFTEGFVSRLGR
jgi:menaquinone-dependent protoporphyrinogen oxidase